MWVSFKAHVYIGICVHNNYVDIYLHVLYVQTNGDDDSLPKKKREDFQLDRLLGEGSYSTVSFGQLLSFCHEHYCGV